jgi:hypothetical protein
MGPLQCTENEQSYYTIGSLLQVILRSYNPKVSAYARILFTRVLDLEYDRSCIRRLN